MSRTIVKYPLTGTHYDFTFDAQIAGEVLAVGIDPHTEPGMWCVTTLADPDEIPTPHRFAIITAGLPLPDGNWRYLNATATATTAWHAFVEVAA